MKPKSRPPALCVVAENPKIPEQPHRRSDDLPFILPPVDIGSSFDFQCQCIGLTRWQIERAHQIVGKSRDQDPRYENYKEAVCRVFRLWRVLEAALDQERRETLAILLEHYPKMTRRIMKGMQRQA
jgi:hypothetical protein